MATDYDAPRNKNEDEGNESIEALKAARSTRAAANENEDADNPDIILGGNDLSNVELDVVVLPPQQDEFTCMGCFLVKHRSQLDHVDGNDLICKDCSV
ncbi:DUF4193 domain-containing protein [Microbacterium amylolyticum]|uniref:DUF4193 domain-containing protein n=1 Tax=Microbacterium amylolyticum TaxID=936337 RepID=A0ABS4ZDY0_9MICO|nr:DUF4193 domain-containing protein [Microbacterium amylolyticum]MBP2435484.1 hypothetical protein [Microbacterium amylolyticum]